VGPYKASNNDINAAIARGQIKRDSSNIRVPVLVFIDYPRPPGDPRRRFGYQPVNDTERAAITAYTRVEAKRVDKRIENLKRSVPSARVVDLPGAGHYLFLTREAEVLSEMHRFVMTLK
jgi:hypothetical protein